MATSLASRIPLEPHTNGNAALGCSNTSATTLPCPSDFEAALNDALLHLRALLKTAQLHASEAPHGSVDATLLSKASEVGAIATELTACLKRTTTTKRTCTTSSSNNNAARVARKKFDPLEASPHASESWGTAAPPTKSSQPSIWSGFYNKTLRERFDVLSLMYPRIGRAKAGSDAHEPAALESTDPVAKLGDLPLRTANLMIENCIGVIGIPLGLGLNFVIDGKSLSVPMAVEEPSVVAAASSAAKLVATFGGGFRTATSGNIMTSQIQLVHTADISTAVRAIAEHRDRLLAIANTTLCPNMKKRGGGAVDIYCRVVSEAARAQSSRTRCTDTDDSDADNRHWYVPCDDELEIRASDPRAQYLVVHIDVDVCEAMGANIVNTVAEGLSDEVCRLTQSQCGLRILTNLCMQRRARSTFEIPVAKLGWKGVDGEVVAQRIVEAYNFAAVDPYRAVTNNKGIMNGVDSVALATGQDYRAIEAAAHCYASRSGQYASLSHYEIATRDSDGERVLRGRLELPIAVGSKGGALQTHPGYTATHAILQQPTARGLSSILLSVGLAQNFAAIRAIAITGIQKGHMALHARNIAVAAGAPSELVSELCAYMLGRQSINVETAKEYLHAHAVFAELQSASPPSSPVAVPLPSMFYVEIPVPHLDAAISLNIAFESINKHPQYIAIRAPPPHANSSSSSSDAGNGSDSVQTTVQRRLLGDKGYNQLEKMFMFLASMRSIVAASDGADSDGDGGAASTATTADTVDAQRRHASRANLALQNRLQLLSVLLNILAYRLLEVRAPAVRELFERLLASADLRDLDAPRSRSLLANVPAADDVLGTGLPLFLALWQVFHYHIEQEVAHPLLRARLVAEQRRLLHSIVQSYELDAAACGPTTTAPAVASNAEQLSPAFVAYMGVQAKRWQATMLLLIDSLTLPSEVLTPARLDFLTRIGEHMEWEGTIAHDIARYTRAATERVPNAFLHWLHARGVAVADAEDHVDAFRRAADVYAQRQWSAITADRESAAARVFSLSAVERVVRIIRALYGERSGQRSRKESF